MDVTTIVSLIGSVGFPIVACIAMAIFIATSFNDFNTLIERNNLLSEELISLIRSNGVSDENEA